MKLVGLFIWKTINPITGNVLGLENIVEPRKAIERYQVGDLVSVRLSSFVQAEGIIGMIRDESKKTELQSVLRNDVQFYTLVEALIHVPGKRKDEHEKESLDQPPAKRLKIKNGSKFYTEPLPPRSYIVAVQKDFRYHYECVRLATFSRYQGSGFGTRLARSGFVYDASRNMVVCPWDGSDVSSEITRNQHIMSCGFVRQFCQINIPLHEAPSPPLPTAFNMAATMTFSPATEEQPDWIQSQTETDSIEMVSWEEPNQNAGSGLGQSSETLDRQPREVGEKC